MVVGSGGGTTTAVQHRVKSNSAHPSVLVNKKKKLGRPKSRTGCLTCKDRRIKCTEEKPECRRCTSTGRLCKGYGDGAEDRYLGSPPSTPDSYDKRVVPYARTWAEDNSPTFPLFESRMLDFGGSSVEHRYLKFFHARTAPILTGYFESDFWKALVPRVGWSEPTIQHAMIAVAAIHEQVEAELPSNMQVYKRDYTSKSTRAFALHQYNKAISYLNRRISDPSNSEEVILLCCVLFICLEFIRGNIGAAISHLKNGMQILFSWRERNGKCSSDAALDLSMDTGTIEDSLRHMFSQLTVQSFLGGRPIEGQKDKLAVDSSALIPSEFSSLSEARTFMDYVVKVCLRMFKDTRQYKYKPTSPEKTHLDQMRYVNASVAQKWITAHSIFLANPNTQLSRQEWRASVILQMTARVVRVRALVSLSPTETAYDEYIDTFSTIVDLGASLQEDNVRVTEDIFGLVNTPSPSEKSEVPMEEPFSFTFEMGVIPALYITATKCREPAVRRMALSLLETTSPRREGLWDANMMAAIAEHVIGMEEEGLVHPAACPEEHKRVHDLIIHSDEEGFRTQHVTFAMRPWSDEWDTIVKKVTWVDGKRHWSVISHSPPKPKPTQPLGAPIGDP